MSKKAPSQVDVVVIGAGAFGYSTALALKLAGVARVVLLDKGDPGDGSSARAAGLFKMVQADEPLTRLTLRSAELVRSFEQRTGVPLRVFNSGSILAARTEPHAALIRAEIANSRKWGVALEEIPSSEVGALAPHIDGEDFAVTVHVHGDLYTEEPTEALEAYHAACVAPGVDVIGHCAATAIEVNEGRVVGVTTAQGPIACETVVDAAGGWAPRVAATAGHRLNAAVVRHELGVTEPIPGIRAGLPILRLIDASAYVRPCRGGLLYGGFEHDPGLVEIPDDLGWSVTEIAFRDEIPERFQKLVGKTVPSLEMARPSEIRGGVFTMTPDARFLAGPAGDIDGLWLNTGCNGSGFSFAPAIGEQLAAWITTGSPEIDMAAMDPRRFGNQVFSDEDLNRLGLFQYANYYTPPDVAREHGLDASTVVDA
ncbi:MAG: NAD(P)/FAD-dependent oxidoreductase [Chloroflexota bacterium]